MITSIIVFLFGPDLHDFCMALDFCCLHASPLPVHSSLCIKMLLCSDIISIFRQLKISDQDVTKGRLGWDTSVLLRPSLRARKTGHCMHSFPTFSIGERHHRGVPEATSTPCAGGQFNTQAADKFGCTKTAWRTNIQRSPHRVGASFQTQAL